MNKLENAKKTYDEIHVPAELSQIVADAIETSNQKRTKKRKPWGRWGAGAAAVLVLSTAVGVNVNETFAMEMQKLPVVGAIMKILTIRTYEEHDGTSNLTIQIPGLESIENDTKNLTQEVNLEISNQCSTYARESQQRAEEYKEAFLETGGTEEEWASHQIEIKVEYEVLSQTSDYLSFVVRGTESWTSAYAETKYYNLNLQNNQYLSLQDILGDRYIETANASILAQMESRTRESGDTFWPASEGGFSTVTDLTKFYMNQQGNPVIVFEKYEIAPGSMGEITFEITK